MFLLIIFIVKNHFKENMGKYNFKKHFKFFNFSEIFHCGITRLRNMNLSVFMESEKYSKVQKLYKVLHFGMTRSRNIKLGVFRQYQNKIYFKEKYGTELF